MNLEILKLRMGNKSLKPMIQFNFSAVNTQDADMVYYRNIFNEEHTYCK